MDKVNQKLCAETSKEHNIETTVVNSIVDSFFSMCNGAMTANTITKEDKGIRLIYIGVFKVEDSRRKNLNKLEKEGKLIPTTKEQLVDRKLKFLTREST